MKELPRFTMRLDLPKEEIAFAINKHFNDYEGDLNKYMNACVDQFDWEREIKDQVDLAIKDAIRSVFGAHSRGYRIKEELSNLLEKKLNEAFDIRVEGGQKK